MKTITVRRLALQFDAGQITRGQRNTPERRAVARDCTLDITPQSV